MTQDFLSISKTNVGYSKIALLFKYLLDVIYFFWNICLDPKVYPFLKKKVNLTTTRINFGSSPRTFLEVSRIHVWDPTHKLLSSIHTYMYFTCFCLIDMFMRKEVSKLEAKDSTMGQDFFWGCISITCLLYWYYFIPLLFNTKTEKSEKQLTTSFWWKEARRPPPKWNTRFYLAFSIRA